MSTLSGTPALVRLALRRDRLRLGVWVLVLLAVTWSSADAMGTAFPTQRAVDAYAASVAGSPAVIAMSGPPVALDTLAGIVLNKVSPTCYVAMALVAVLTVVRHTRAEEELGRTELLRAVVVGRHAGSLAALLVAVLVSVVVGAGTAVAVHAADVPGRSSWLFGMSVTALGVVFAAVALVCAQVFAHARAALGAALGVLGVSYVVRAAGDVRENGLVWLSPVGWVQATHPLGAERWWPLLVPLAAAGLLAGAALAMADRRDVGAGLVAQRPGSSSGSRWLAGPVGLTWRLQRGALLGWAGGLLALALAVGSLSREVAQMARDNPTLSSYLAASGRASPTDSYFATMLLILALLAAAFAVSSALRLHSEETAGRLEVLLATGLSRTRWVLGSLTVTLAGTVVLLVVSGLGVGISYGLVASDAGQPLRMAGLMLVYAPAALSVAAVGVLLVGWAPRAAVVAWALLGGCFLLGWLGGLLHPPRWLASLSPFRHTPAVPADPVTLLEPSLVTLAVVLLVAAGVVGVRRRDLG